jgi:hypothetical protein
MCQHSTPEEGSNADRPEVSPTVAEERLPQDVLTGSAERSAGRGPVSGKLRLRQLASAWTLDGEITDGGRAAPSC